MRHPLPRFNPAPLSLAIALALTAPGFVQAQAADSGKAVSLSISTQSLGSALNELSAATGTPIAFSPALVAGKTAPAIKGNLTLRQALSQLLAGSGLAASEDGSSIVIKNVRTASDQESTLPAVNVTAQSVRDGSTEGTGSYTTNASRTATKLSLSPRETPQTLTVVTRQKMDDFGLDNVEEVLMSTSGVMSQNAGINAPHYYVRGFSVQSQYDGISNPGGIGQNNRSPLLDTAFLDKVEVLQGASGLLSGAGDPGGSINLIRKRPTSDFQAHVETQIGSWNKKRLVGDISGPLVESGKIRGRLVALTDHSDSFRKNAFDNHEGIYGVIEADITAATKLSASVMHQTTENNDDNGVPMGPDGADLGLPRSSFYGNAKNRTTRKISSYQFNLDQKLTDDWSLKLGYAHTELQALKTAGGYPSGTLDVASGNGLNLLVNRHDRKFSSDVIDAYVSGPFNLLGRKHEAAFGATVSRDESLNRVSAWATFPINIYSFDPASISTPALNLPDWPTPDKTKQDGVYGVARLEISDELKLIIGARASWYEYSQAGILKQKEKGTISPYGGLVWDLSDNYSAYISYSDIFKPQSNLTTSGGTVNPIVGKNYEVGVKGDFYDGRLNSHAAIFRLEQTNLAEIDTSVGRVCGGANCYTASGLVVTKGVDFGLNGEIFNGWQIGGGYTYVDSKYANGANDGKPYRSYIPKHMLRAYTTYQIPDSAWTIGGSISLIGKKYLQGAAYRIEQGGYATVDLMAKYRINKKAEIGINLKNAFDRRYYETVGSYSTVYENFYGAPRSIYVNLKYQF